MQNKYNFCMPNVKYIKFFYHFSIFRSIDIVKKIYVKNWYCAGLSYLFNDYVFLIIVLGYLNIHELTHIILVYFHYDSIEMLFNDNLFFEYNELYDYYGLWPNYIGCLVLAH